MRSLKNVHLTPGGEIEKRFAFTRIKEVYPGSVGLIEMQQKIYTFLPGGPFQNDPTDPIFDVGYIGLEAGHISAILDHDLFDNQAFVIADTGGGLIQHFYNGALVPNAHGSFCRTYKTKMYAIDGSVLYFSAVGNAADWTGTGSGTIDLSLEDSDMGSLIALEVYYNWLAVFSETSVQLWSIDPDPLQNQFQQTLHQAGTIAPRSALQYGSGDVLYLAPDGIRSLRARNASLAAAVSDIGSPLDPVIQDLFRTKGKAWLQPTISILQPVAGRFWIILPDRIYVLSDFPGPKITAWSEYDPTDENGNPFTITAAAMSQQRIYVRDDNDNVYVYGGNDPTGAMYDNCPVEIVFPYHPGAENLAATFKKFHGLDAACQGEWDVYASYDPTTEAEDYIGKLIGPTFLQGRLAMEGHSTHLSLRLRATQPGPMLLSNMIVHYDLAETG